jgi:hypothetical protein
VRKQQSKANIDYNSNFNSKEDFTYLYDGVSYGSKDEWMSGLEIQDGDQTIFSIEPINNNIADHQVYAIIQ